MNDKLILARVDKTPEINMKVYNSKGEVIGVVYDLLGPVKNPYVLIRLSKDIDVNYVKKEKVYFKN
ncbi:MAG: hypothetical protein NZ926_02505 [Candidatus Methanomethylicia archaeon]|nr:hypothetical protein [Candidatus Methanomethylicia archaeon]